MKHKFILGIAGSVLLVIIGLNETLTAPNPGVYAAGASIMLAPLALGSILTAAQGKKGGHPKLKSEEVAALRVIAQMILNSVK